MPKLPESDLRQNFKTNLSNIFEVWDNYMAGLNLNPFKDTDEVMNSDMDNDTLIGFYANLNYALGVHDALGWDLHDPRGPKEWSPL